MSLLNRLSKIKKDTGNKANKEISSKYNRRTEANPLGKTDGKLNIPIKERRRDSKNIKNIEKDDKNIRKLTSYIMYPEKFKDMEIEQGNLGKLYDMYFKLEKLHNTILENEKSMNQKINNMETKLPELKEEALEKFKDAENRKRKGYEDSLTRMKFAISKEIGDQKKMLVEGRESVLNEYTEMYNKELSELSQYKNAVGQLIVDFGIPRRAITVPNNTNSNEIAPVEIYKIVAENARLITQLETTNVSMWSEESLENLFSDRNSQIKTAGMVSLGAFLAPMTFSVGIFNLGKKLVTVSKIKNMVKQLEDEILLCDKLITEKLYELRDDYNEPDVSDIDERLKIIDSEIEGIYKDRLTEAEKNLDEFLSKSRDRNQKFTREVEYQMETKKKEIEMMKNRMIAEKTSSQGLLNQNREEYIKEHSSFSENQKTLSFKDEELDELLNELSWCIKSMRLFSELELMNSLNYDVDISPTEDDPTVIAMREYDKELLQSKKELESKVAKLQAEGWTEKKLGDKMNTIERKIDKYYTLDTSETIDGHIYTDPEIMEVVKTYEVSTYPYDNRSIVFVYDTPEEEDLIIDYIKVLVQQSLANNHPESVIVSIISKARSNKFNNLQVDLDVFDVKTQEMKKGVPYCNVYSDPESINNIYDEQLSNISKLNAGGLIDKTFDELVLYLRGIGGIVPKYNINVLYGEDFYQEIVSMSKESDENGLINYIMVPRSEFYTINDNPRDKNDILKPNMGSKSQLDNFSLIAEVMNIGDNPVMYITDFNNRKLSRVLTTVRDRGDIVNVGKILRDRHINISKKKNFTLVKEYIDQVTGGKYWQKSANKQLELHFGYLEGDKSKAYPVILNEDSVVHMFFGGTTGGGKSNILGVLINSLKMMYPPSELDVYYFDFKVVEVAMHIKPYKMPHCSAMTGTSSAEYLISLLQFIFDEMENRYHLLETWGVQKLSEIQNAMRDRIKELREEGRNSEADELFKDMPRRTVIIIDEVAQGFKHPDGDVVEVIKEILTKLGELARAAGMHMILVSQEPGKIPPTLLDLLKVKGCTMATPAVSKAVVGNNMCGKLENQFMGFFGINTAGGDEEANRRYVVPFNNPGASSILTKIAYEMSEKDINRDAVVFSDRGLYEYSDIRRYLRNLNVDIDNLMNSAKAREDSKSIYKGNNFFLGEAAYYSPNFKPLEVILERNDMENIAISSTRRDNIEDHFNLIYKQLAPYADCVPIYCKSVPEYAPVELFKENNKDNQLFCPMFAKNIMEEGEVYEVEIEERLDKEGNPIKTKIVKENKDYLVYQVVKGDIFTRPLDRTDATSMEFYNRDLLKYLDTVIRLRKSEPEKYAKRPLYLFAFDFTGHSSMAMNEFPWRPLASAINDANSCGVHLIAFSNSISQFDSRNIFSKVIAGTLMTNEQYGVYRGIPTGFNKLVDKQDTGNSRTYKVVRGTKI